MWFSGLPGSGKSTIARLIVKATRVSPNPPVLISMDAIRRLIYPSPTYSDMERDAAYRALALTACLFSRAGTNVLIDATGHKLLWRDLARSICPRFVEVYVKCPIETCIERETERKDNDSVRRKLYLSALSRLRSKRKNRGLGKVPGVDEPFEESRRAEIVIDSHVRRPRTLADEVLKELCKFAPDVFRVAG